MTEVNKDLLVERSKCTFNIKELTNFIDGGPENTLERKEREAIFLSEEVVHGVPNEYLSNKEVYEMNIKKSVAFFKTLQRWRDECNIDLSDHRSVLKGLLQSSTFNDGTPLALHYMMFIPSCLSQGNAEQQSYWLGRAMNFDIIGTYAQTELGHGTFIRGLETTATYDPSTKEFVLHSPTLTSYKWWPGGLGHTANYCIVVAQLYTKGQCHGIHSFMVQVRDEETHMPLPGIKIGDIGAKLALNPVNNGFLGLDNVRIPRDHMLMKHAQVLEDGTYVKSRNSKLNYGAMVFVRVVIVFDMINYLSKAVTIAIRYSAVRRQCRIKDVSGEPECQILDFVTQQHKLFIAIATCHAFKTTSNYLWDTYNEVNQQLDGGKLDRLQELHVLACCLKAVSTADSAAFVERCRLSCGGHGYMQSSNLPLMYGQVTAACTYEGDNTVLLLQTARFLVKTWREIETSPMTPTIAYLKITSAKGFRNKFPSRSVDSIVRGFQITSMRKIATCVEFMQKRIEKGLSIEDAWNLTSVQLVAAAEMHCRTIIISTFHEGMKKACDTMSPELRIVMQQLVKLYAVYWALEKLNDLIRFTRMTMDEVGMLQSWYEELLSSIRPNAVGLVDAFDIPDEMLNSTLGSYDGRVYERLMEETLKSPLNEEPVNWTFHKCLKPMMKGKL